MQRTGVDADDVPEVPLAPSEEREEEGKEGAERERRQLPAGQLPASCRPAAGQLAAAFFFFCRAARPRPEPGDPYSRQSKNRGEEFPGSSTRSNA